jgi:hypothetical protein
VRRKDFQKSLNTSIALIDNITLASREQSSFTVGQDMPRALYAASTARIPGRVGVRRREFS